VALALLNVPLALSAKVILHTLLMQMLASLVVLAHQLAPLEHL
jgi:hypothetical protein